MFIDVHMQASVKVMCVITALQALVSYYNS